MASAVGIHRPLNSHEEPTGPTEAIRGEEAFRGKEAAEEEMMQRRRRRQKH